MLRRVAARTHPCVTVLRVWGLTIVLHISLHAVMKLPDHLDVLLWSTERRHDFPKTLTADSVEDLGYVHKGGEETVLLLTFPFEGPGNKNHVHRTDSGVVARFPSVLTVCSAEIWPRTFLQWRERRYRGDFTGFPISFPLFKVDDGGSVEHPY